MQNTEVDLFYPKVDLFLNQSRPFFTKKIWIGPLCLIWCASPHCLICCAGILEKSGLFCPKSLRWCERTTLHHPILCTLVPPVSTLLLTTYLCSLGDVLSERPRIVQYCLISIYYIDMNTFRYSAAYTISKYRSRSVVKKHGLYVFCMFGMDILNNPI